MVKKLLFLIALISTNWVSGQELISSAGANFDNSTYQISYSVGETVTATFSTADYTLNQGFQQGNLSVTSIADPAQKGFSVNVYPNPVQNRLTIEADVQGAEYHIANMQGKVVKTGKITEKALQIDFSALPNGTYLLQVNEQHTHKIIKQ